MTIKTIIEYLFGSRHAILRIAAQRQAVWLGLLFVVSAGLAREYDGHDLLREPWHLLVPLGASLATSFLLYCLVIAVAKRRGGLQGSYFGLYRSFLGLYWLTAPLAWLYAIPVERFLTPAAATEANLWLLAAVSAWRVALMTRVVAVLFQVRALGAFFVVMLFADTVALAILWLSPLPIFDIMGGIRLTPQEQVVQGAATLTGCLGGVSWLVWLFGTVAVTSSGPSGWRQVDIDEMKSTRISGGVWALSALSILAWVFVLPATQAEQRLRRQVERALKQGRLEDGLAILNSHDRSDFPPHWDPPPQVGYGEDRPSVLDVLEILATKPSRPWVLDVYSEKFRNQQPYDPLRLGPWPALDDQALARHLSLLESLPNAARMVADNEKILRYMLEEQQRPKAVRERIESLLESVGPAGGDGTENEMEARESNKGEDSLEHNAAD